MGCGPSKAKKGGRHDSLPRAVRRADVLGGPPAPDYYSSSSNSSRRGSKAKPADGAQRRLTVLQEGTSSARDSSDGAALADVKLSEKAVPVEKTRLPVRQIATVSMVGYDPKKPRKANQDNLFGDACFTDPSLGFFAVFDGHGQYGELCSEFLVDTLPPLLRKNLARVRVSDRKGLEKGLRGSFLASNDLLQKHGIDTALSGSTCTSAILTNQGLLTANVGDSRTVAAYLEAGSGQGGPRRYVARALTVDHKPDIPGERARILARGGRVAPWAQSDLDHIFRVWLKDEDTPGIAMSRSFGDRVAAQVGIIAEPDCAFHELGPDLSFVLLATDGVWEFMDNQEAVDIVINEMRARGRTFHQAVDTLVAESNERWLQNEGVADDITVIGLLFNLPV